MNEREVIRCSHCQLNQFLTISGKCRKCQVSLLPESIVPAMDVTHVTPVTPVTSEPGRREIDYGFALKFLRTCNGLSQPGLAVRLGVPRTYISKIENSKCTPLVATLLKFCVALECTPSAFLLIAQGN